MRRARVLLGVAIALPLSLPFDARALAAGPEPDTRTSRKQEEHWSRVTRLKAGTMVGATVSGSPLSSSETHYLLTADDEAMVVLSLASYVPIEARRVLHDIARKEPRRLAAGGRDGHITRENIRVDESGVFMDGTMVALTADLVRAFPRGEIDSVTVVACSRLTPPCAGFIALTVTEVVFPVIKGGGLVGRALPAMRPLSTLLGAFAGAYVGVAVGMATWHAIGPKDRVIYRSKG